MDERTIDQRIDALAQTVELLAGMHQQTEAEIKALAKEVRRFQYWAEAIILNFDSRLRALAKDPPPE
jgi:hypothetical protein